MDKKLWFTSQQTSMEGKMEKKWFKSGWDDLMEEKRKLDAYIQVRREKAAVRFWLRPDEEANIMFVDDDPAVIYEHTIKVGDRFEKVVCIKEIAPCPVCQAFPSNYASLTAYLTVLDFRKYINRDGQEVAVTKKLFPMKSTMQGMLFDIMKQYKTVKWLLCRVKRYSSQAGASGNYIVVEKRIKDPLKELVLPNKDLLVPFDYSKVFAPLSQAELEMLGIVAPAFVGSEDNIITEAEDAESIFEE